MFNLLTKSSWRQANIILKLRPERSQHIENLPEEEFY